MEEPEKVIKETEDEESDVEGHRIHKRDDSPTVEREKLSSEGDDDEPDVEAHKLHK